MQSAKLNLGDSRHHGVKWYLCDNRRHITVGF